MVDKIDFTFTFAPNTPEGKEVASEIIVPIDIDVLAPFSKKEAFIQLVKQGDEFKYSSLFATRNDAVRNCMYIGMDCLDLGIHKITVPEIFQYSAPLVPTTCSKCKQVKMRKAVGISKNGKKKYYVDDKGKRWNGKQCPDCTNRSSAIYMKKVRAKHESEE